MAWSVTGATAAHAPGPGSHRLARPYGRGALDRGVHRGRAMVCLEGRAAQRRLGLWAAAIAKGGAGLLGIAGILLLVVPLTLDRFAAARLSPANVGPIP